MDTAQTFRRTLSFLAAGLLAAATGQAATLVVDNNNIPLTGTIQSRNVSVASSDGSALNFDIAINYLNPPPGFPQWLNANVSGCAGVTNCPTPATLSLSLANDLAQYAGPFTATVSLTPHLGGTSTTITVIFYPGPAGIPGAIVVTPSAFNPASILPIAFSTGQTTIPTAQVLVNSNQSYSVRASTLSGGDWLVVSASGIRGTQLLNLPSSVILTITLKAATAAMLAAELYQGFVVVTSADGTSQATIDVNLSVNGGTNGAITASPSRLTFAYSTDASPLGVPLQTIVVSTPTGSSFTATTNHPEWIVLQAQATGTVPGAIVVGVNPSALTEPDDKSGKVTITVGSVSLDVPVELTVSVTPVLWAKTSNTGGTILFTAQGPVSTPTSQSVTLIASDGLSTALSVLSYPSWVSVALNGNTLSITPHVSGTAPAVLSDVVVVTSTRVENNPLSIPILLVQNGGGAAGPLTINPSSLSFYALAGGTTPDPQTVTVSAPATTGFNVSTLTNNGISWLQVYPSFGGSTDTTLSIAVNPQGLAPSVTPYTGAVSLSVPNGVLAQTIPVTLTVSAAGGGNVTTDTNSLNLTGQIGTQKQTGTVTVSNATGGTAPVLYNVSTSSSAPWLKATPAQATTQSIVTITADPSGLAVQTYQGQVTIAPVGGHPVTVNVTFTVQALPVISAPRTSFTFTYLAGGEIPPAQTVQISGGAFTAAVSSGASWLAVSPSSGHTTTILTMSVTPSGLSPGSHSGTIAVAGANNIVTINVTLNVTTPLLTVTSVVNGASLLPGAIAPGEVISIFGTELGPTTAVTPQFDAAGHLATTLGGVQVLVNGYAAPLIYASSGQVTAVVPYQIAGFPQATVQVAYLNRNSNTTTVAVTNTSPAIFTLNTGGSGPGARNVDFSPNGPGNPVVKGGSVVFFMTGEGPLSPTGITGRVNPATGPGVAIAALQVGVLIDNHPANWTYAGGVPGVVEGIMQLNVQIPPNARSGDLPVLVTIGGNGSQANVTVSVK